MTQNKKKTHSFLFTAKEGPKFTRSRNNISLSYSTMKAFNFNFDSFAFNKKKQRNWKQIKSISDVFRAHARNCTAIHFRFFELFYLTEISPYFFFLTQNCTHTSPYIYSYSFQEIFHLLHSHFLFFCHRLPFHILIFMQVLCTLGVYLVWFIAQHEMFSRWRQIFFLFFTKYWNNGNP